MKSTKRVWRPVLSDAAGVLRPRRCSNADDGFSTSYTYTYDYWEDVQESPDAYRVATVIDTMTLGLDNLENRISKPQSLYARGNAVYVRHEQQPDSRD